MASSSSSSSSKRHPLFHGIRCRGRKWVSEIREPRKASRIWLGTFQTPEMAAAAYDVAALALKGNNAVVNLPHYIGKYQMPPTNSHADIRSAATVAAELVKAEATNNIASMNVDHHDNGNTCHSVNDITSYSWFGSDFIDEEAIFGMPNLLVDMAGGMLLSPPRIWSPPSLEKPGGENLWNFCS
ncbi:hypothetical protein Lal_00026496 [Lupinus albus]|uniref:Putative transcription factor AP2-EREBP family n=1 Tax=Lupinus albus TaxID=3870 RepID=A0A6A5LQC5_LUPAL|nr:putative transcription factor AP2-EREBP family [Lupinus albus]KAF1861993.1 hypothetical protein Lal_00026496 [Lupinus albus]